MKNNNQGFTLVEILTALAIICLLITISVVATLQARMRSRDSRRISDATTIMNALESYYAANQSYPTMITEGQPIMLGSMELLKTVPNNPFPRTDGGCADEGYVYTTTSTGYKLTFCLGSDHGRFSKGVVICKNGNCGIKDDCSGEIVDGEGIRYPIIEIGNQCWMAMHLKSKRRPNSACVNIPQGYAVDGDCMTQQGGYWYGGFGGCPAGCIPGSRRDCIKLNPPIYGSSQNYGWDDRGFDIISANYEYPPVLNNSTCNLRGALYTWSGAMNLNDDALGDNCNSMSCNHLISTPHRGICPQNWHIPTDQEFNILEQYLTNSPFTCDSNRNSTSSPSCQNAGTRLVVGGDSGFNAILLGIREGYSGDSFSLINEQTRFWTTTVGPAGYEAVVRTLKTGDSGTYRHYQSKDSALAVRCIRDY